MRYAQFPTPSIYSGKRDGVKYYQRPGKIMAHYFFPGGGFTVKFYPIR